MASSALLLLALFSVVQAGDYNYKLGESLSIESSYTSSESEGYSHEPKPPADKAEKKYKEVAVEGFVYCQHGYEKTPLGGAVVGAGCSNSDAFLEAKTRSDGYFYIPLNYNSYRKVDPKSYRVFLVSSPEPNCNVKTNSGNGKTGAPLEEPKEHPDLTLYTVGPFAFTPSSNAYTSPKYNKPPY